MNIKSIDSIQIPVKNVAAAQRFYHEVFDLPVVDNGANNTLQLGKQQLVLVTADDAGLKAPNRQPGSAELALATKDPLDKTLAHLTNYAVEIDDGPLDEPGANGQATVLWLRDLDHNLIKLVCY